jgi:hypothetical protein
MRCLPAGDSAGDVKIGQAAERGVDAAVRRQRGQFGGW